MIVFIIIVSIYLAIGIIAAIVIVTLSVTDDPVSVNEISGITAMITFCWLPMFVYFVFVMLTDDCILNKIKSITMYVYITIQEEIV